MRRAQMMVALCTAILPLWAGATPDELAFPSTGNSYFYDELPALAVRNKSPICSSTRARWDAPRGALVSSQASLRSSPVRRGIQALGGFRTHTMLSHGPEWVTQATIAYATTTDKKAVCRNEKPPFNPARTSFGYPGASQVNMAGLFNYLYVNDGISYLAQQSGNPPANIRAGLVGTVAEPDPSVPDPGGAIADWAWGSMPYYTVTKTLTTAATCQTVGPVQICLPTAGGSSIFYQLLDAYSRPIFYKLGNMANYSTAQTSDGTGAVCSDFIYRLQYWSQAMKMKFVAPVQSGYLTIPHDTSVAGITAFRNQVRDLCNSEVSNTTIAIGQFMALLTLNMDGCTRSKNSICAGAADQMARCIVSWNSSCAEQSPHYTTIMAPTSYKVNGLSPDAVAGWIPYSYNFSTWAWDGDHDVNWNTSGGTQYGCWSN
jgi:hypothetical protein